MQALPDDRQERPEAAPRGQAAALLHGTWRTVRRVVIGVVGSVVLLAGLVLLVTPGPAFVVIPIGLGILAIEFPWARRWLEVVRERIRRAVGRDQDGEPAS